MEKNFYGSVMKIAIPVAAQSLLQASFSVVDQLMIGQLGSGSIAGVGLGGKFAALYSVLLGGAATAAGILISQYMGQKNDRETSRSFFANMGIAVFLGILFLLLCLLFPGPIMRIYTRDEAARQFAVKYLQIYAWGFVPMAVSGMTAVLLRCMEAARLPLYAAIVSAVLNTGLNYLLIFGRGGLPKMGVQGAALATVLSQTAACVLTIAFFWRHYKRQEMRLAFLWKPDKEKLWQYLGILGPLLICEFLWCLGENVYTAIYGNMGTEACAAVTLTVPVQTLLIGALSGLSQAAGILIGKDLGAGEYDRATRESRKLMRMGLLGSLLLSALLIGTGGFYVKIFRVEPQVRRLARQILVAFAVIAPVKVQNMILGGGIVRSGGKTKYIMWIDLIGTWMFGVPLGLLGAFVWKLSVPWVYFILSLEECVRFALTVVVFEKGIWKNLL